MTTNWQCRSTGQRAWTIAQSTLLFVCRLKESLYGLKQSSRCWNTALHDHLVDVGFKESVHDPCIYTRIDAILAVHVDDIIVATDGVWEMKQVKRDIPGPFDVRDL